MESSLHVLLTGMGATLITDLWSLARRRLFGLKLPDYRLIGRWLGRMRHGEFRHQAIVKAPAIRGEHAIGWIAHYAIGVAFAVLPLACWGRTWMERPTSSAGLLTGLATVAAPLLIMQPAMGVRRTPLQSLVTHAVFGLGLFVSAALYRALRY
jgi:hypothetical protein